MKIAEQSDLEANTN